MADLRFPTIISDRVAEITLAAGKVNALSIEAASALAEKIEALGRSTDISVIVIRNDGHSFCVGADIKEIAGDPSLIGASNRAWLRLASVCHRCEVPVIAAVDGHCIGGGIVLAGSCDILLLSHRSTFSLPQVKSGGWGAGTFLMRLLGPLKIRAAMFTGRTLTANEIAAGGQVEDVLPPEQLRDAARTLAGDIAQYSVEAIRAGKAALNGIELLNLEESYRFEHAFTTELFVSPKVAARRKELKKGTV
jgi:enoyl-CoA hydratase